MNVAPKPLRRLPFLVALACAPAACQRAGAPPAGAANLELGLDLRPIEAESLATHVQARHRALRMPAAELAARLGAFRFDAEDSIRIEDGNGTLQNERTRSFVSWDANGNVHMQTVNATRSLELFAIGEKAYVRLDRGHLRYKSRRDVDVHELLQVATGGLVGLLSAYGGATFGVPESSVLGEASVWTYALAPKEREVGEAPLALLPQPPGTLAPPLPSTWSENASHKEIAGKIAVDAATGALLRASVEGRMRISVGASKTLTVTLAHRHAIRNVGQVAPIVAPTGAVAEFRRPLRPHEPLSFFKEHLHADANGRLQDFVPEADPEAPARPAKTPAPRR